MNIIKMNNNNSTLNYIKCIIMSNGKLLLFYNKDKNVLCLYFNLAIFPHIIFYFILILEYVVDSVRLGLCGSSASFLCLWGYKDGMSLHDMFGCSHVPNKHTHTHTKAFLTPHLRRSSPARLAAQPEKSPGPDSFHWETAGGCSLPADGHTDRDICEDQV